MTALLVRVEKTPDGFWAVRIGTEIVDRYEYRHEAESEAASYRKDVDQAAHDAYCAKLDRERREREEKKP